MSSIINTDSSNTISVDSSFFPNFTDMQTTYINQYPSIYSIDVDLHSKKVSNNSKISIDIQRKLNKV